MRPLFRLKICNRCYINMKRTWCIHSRARTCLTKLDVYAVYWNRFYIRVVLAHNNCPRHTSLSRIRIREKATLLNKGTLDKALALHGEILVSGYFQTNNEAGVWRRRIGRWKYHKDIVWYRELFYLHTMLVFKVKIESLFYTRKCEFACVYVCIVC